MPCQDVFPELFQKNLIVWKLNSDGTASVGLREVSEELNSVETERENEEISRTCVFQKNLIVWKHKSYNNLRDRIKVSEELNSVET